MHLFPLMLMSLLVSVSEGTRGVAPHLKAMYTGDDKRFKCLDDSNIIDFEQVNDDYCDCQDGSDEPGTSACPSGSFFCLNDGHVGRRLPSSRVGDLICDCCDGSDEWEHREGVNCPDVCEEVGRAHRERHERMANTRAEGNRLRQQRIEQAKDLTLKLNNELGGLKADIARIESEMELKERAKERAEVAEKTRLRIFNEQRETLRLAKEERELAIIKGQFDALDMNKDEYLSREEVELAVRFFDIDGDNEVSEDEADIALDGIDSITMDDFPEKYRDAMQRASGDESEELRDKYYGATHPAVYNDEVDVDDDREYDRKFGNDVHPRQGKSSSYELYDEITKRAVDEANEAREEVRALREELKEKEKLIAKINKDLRTDFGKDGEFFALRDECFTFEDQPYVYKVCLFDSITQAEGERTATKLGQWDSWQATDDGQENSYSMLYLNGHKCWNGPDRSTRLIVQCGLQDRLVDFSEPNKCQYEGIFETPSACTPLTTQGKDEL